MAQILTYQVIFLIKSVRHVLYTIEYINGFSCTLHMGS